MSPLTPVIPKRIDRRVLPIPAWFQRNEENYIAPRTALEKQLADIWSQLLGIEPIGIYDKFFELGGHSLLVIQLIA